MTYFITVHQICQDKRAKMPEQIVTKRGTLLSLQYITVIHVYYLILRVQIFLPYSVHPFWI